MRFILFTEGPLVGENLDYNRRIYIFQTPLGRARRREDGCRFRGSHPGICKVRPSNSFGGPRI